jgi:hypothetical protein
MGFMQRIIRLLLPVLSAGLFVLAALFHLPAAAQNSAKAWANYALAVYSGPDQTTHIVGILKPQTQIILEARNTDAAWVLGRSVDGLPRGWIQSHLLEYAPGANIPSLPLSDEVMFVLSEARSTASYRDINLNDYPIIPASIGQAGEIFKRGQARGANSHVVAKIGDCLSDNEHFLSPFGWDGYQLGQYGALQSVINHFSKSLAYDSLAAREGLVTTAVLDATFANPLACLPGESPLRCEYRLHQPSVAIIMFGTQDLLFTSAEQFDLHLRRIVHETIESDVIPILSTFPGYLADWDRAIQYNQIVVQVALDYDIPLLNLWRALEALPNHGLNADGRHLSQPLTNSGDLTTVNLQRGFPLRNLVTLQALDIVWRNAMD